MIGHEMGHGFDDQGRKSDGDGVQRDWWTEADAVAYEKRASKLADQYSSFEPLPGEFLNGRLGLGENIGDLTGVTMAYNAYKKSLNGKEAPVIDGFTGDQRFFMAWAQVWAIKWKEEALSQQSKMVPIVRVSSEQMASLETSNLGMMHLVSPKITPCIFHQRNASKSGKLI